MKLNIKWDEYGLMSYVHFACNDIRFSKNGWCTDEKQDLAEWLGVNAKTLGRKVDKLVGLGLLIKHPSKFHLKSTKKWSQCVETLSFMTAEEKKQIEENENPKIAKFIEDVGKIQYDLLFSEKEILKELSDKKRALLRRWLKYKNQYNKKPLATSIQVQSLIGRFKETPYLDLKSLIEYSIENDYPALYWDRLKK